MTARAAVVIFFVIAGMGLAYYHFRRFPWAEPPTRLRFLGTLLVYLLIGGAIGLLAGGWAAGRVP